MVKLNKFDLRTIALAAVLFSARIARADDWKAPDLWIKFYRASVTKYAPYQASVIDASIPTVYSLIGLNRKSGMKSHPFHDAEFTNGPVMLRAFAQAKPAPLMVLLPGMNATLDDPYFEFFGRTLKDKGFHVMYMPGIFSREYRRAEPLHPAGSFRVEGAVALRAALHMRTAIERAKGPGSVTSIRLLTLSYGSTIGAIALSQSNGAIADLTAISPPFAIRDTRAKLDRAMADELNPYPWDMTKYGALSVTTQFGGGSDSRKNFIWVFHRNIIELGAYFYRQGRCRWPALSRVAEAHPAAFAKKFDSDADMDGLPWSDREKMGPWLAELNFTNIIRYCTPQNEFQYSNGDDEFMTWVRASPPGTVRAVVAADDPINSSAEFGEAPELADGRRLILLPYGDHTGFIYTNWMKRLIEASVRTPALGR